jgi:hypothetical protein
MGFDVFTIANNHTLDKDEDGLKACLDYWDKNPEVTVAGAYRNKDDRNNIRTKEVNGVVFSFLSYTEFLNGLSLPSDSEMIIGDATNVPLMISQIKKAKEISDVCVVSLHWGVENSDIITMLTHTAKHLAIRCRCYYRKSPAMYEKYRKIKVLTVRKPCCLFFWQLISAQNILDLIGGFSV